MDKLALIALASVALLGACPKKREPAPVPAPPAAADPASTQPGKSGLRVISTVPRNGARDVPVTLDAVSVVFNRPMKRDGWSFVAESDETALKPTGAPSFDTTGRVASLPVKLEPSTSYVVWINSKDEQRFRDITDTPVPPHRLSFSTQGSPKPAGQKGKVLVDGMAASQPAGPQSAPAGASPP